MGAALCRYTLSYRWIMSILSRSLPGDTVTCASYLLTPPATSPIGGIAMPLKTYVKTKRLNIAKRIAGQDIVAPATAPVPAKFKELFDAASDDMGYLLDVYFPVKADSTPDSDNFDPEAARQFCYEINVLVAEVPSSISTMLVTPVTPVTPAPAFAPAPQPAPVAAPTPAPTPAPADPTPASQPRPLVRRRATAPAGAPADRKSANRTKKVKAFLTSPH